jgi:hypothetical protein
MQGTAIYMTAVVLGWSAWFVLSAAWAAFVIFVLPGLM